jgi:hypothetical protein
MGGLSEDNVFSDGMKGIYFNVAGPIDRYVAVKRNSLSEFFCISRRKQLLNLWGKVN